MFQIFQASSQLETRGTKRNGWLQKPSNFIWKACVMKAWRSLHRPARSRFTRS